MHKHITLLKGLIVALGLFLFIFVALMMIIGESISNPPVQVDYSHSHASTDTSNTFPAGSNMNTSKTSGSWSDASTWTKGVPTPDQVAVISPGHTVTLDSPIIQVSGAHISSGATLAFDTSKSILFGSSQNVLVEGVLRMKPSNASIIHTLRFVNKDGSGINNNASTGGTMDPIPEDIGLWVMGPGKLELEGSNKTSWTNASGSISQGTNSVSLATSPSGWRVGDEISISPTEPPSVGSFLYSGFDESTIQSISGNTLQLSTATTRAHPRVNNKWSAEVMNLTRNVRVEGTPPEGPSGGWGYTNYHNAHVFIRNTTPAAHIIKNIELRYVGARSTAFEAGGQSKAPAGIVPGRYGLHFHHSLDNVRGLIVENVVIRDGGNRAFVPHASNGITFRGTISYNVDAASYWWDTPEEQSGKQNTTNQNFLTDDTLYENCIAAAGKGLVGGGFVLPAGSGNTVRNCIAVGQRGSKNSSGFNWPSSVNAFGEKAIWNFTDNVGHNNQFSGIRVWQNTGGNHLVNNFTAYHNLDDAIDHGAYSNTYVYRNLTAYGNGNFGIQQHAQTGYGRWIATNETLTFDKPTITGGKYAVIINRHNLPNNQIPGRQGFEESVPVEDGAPTIYRDCNFTGQTVAKILMNEPWAKTVGETIDNPGLEWFIRCNIQPSDIAIQSVHPLSVIKVQNYDTPQNGSYGFVMRFGANNTIASVTNLTSPLPDPVSGASPPPTSPTIDTTSPTISLTSPAQGDTVSGSINLSATASDNVGVSGVTFKVDGVTVGAEDTSAPYTVSWNSALVSNGSHTISATARDAVGNVKTASITVTVSNTVQDITPPTVSVTSPAAGATISGNVTLSATASDNSGFVRGVTFKIDGVQVGLEDTASPFTMSWNSELVSNGSHAVTATARDASGNTKISNVISFTVSNGTLQPTVDLKVDKEVVAAGTSVTLSWVSTNSDSCFGTGDWSGTLATSGSKVVQINTDSSFKITCTKGSLSASDMQGVTIADTTNPTISLSSPASGATVSATTTLSATAADNVGVVGVTFKIDGVTVADDTSSPYSVSWNSKSVSNGSHTVTATARDAAGNTNAASRSFTVSNQTETVDTTDPNVSITAPAQGSTVKGTIEVTAAATDNKAVTEVQFRLNGALLGSKDTSSPYSVSWDTTNATEGTNTLTAEAKDAAGNSRVSSAVTVTVDNVESTSGSGGGGSSSSNDDDDEDEDEDDYEDDLDDDEVVVVPPPVVPPVQTPILGRVITTSNLSVRTSPGTAYPQIAVVPAGTRGSVLAGPTYVYGYAWLRVAYDTGVTGWSSRTWLVADASTAPAPVYTQPAPSGSTLTPAQKTAILSQILELYKQVALLQAQLKSLQQ